MGGRKRDSPRTRLRNRVRPGARLRVFPARHAERGTAV